MIIINLYKLDNETDFEYKVRLCNAKLNKEIDLDWAEIVSLLGLDIHYDSLRKMAYGYQEYDNYIKNKDSVYTRILSLSDFHIPYQKPIQTFEKYVGIVDILQLNGDVLDCQAISKFSKTYRVSPMEEIISGRQYLIDLINYIKPKKVVINYGNHDIRFQNYLAKNLDTDILELMPQTSLELIFVDGFNHYDKKSGTKVLYKPLKKVFEEQNIEIDYTDNWFCQIGQSIFCHPFAFASNPMKTSEKAMYWFRNEGYNFSSLIMAHTHKVGQYTIGNTILIEQGCCCDTIKNSYNGGKLINSQKEGFVYLCQDNNGKVIDNKIELVCLN